MAFEYDSNELRNRRGEDLVAAFERLVAGYHSILEKEGISRMHLLLGIRLK